MLDILLVILFLGLWLVVVGVGISFWVEFFNGLGIGALALAILLTIIALLPVAYIRDEYKKDTAAQSIEIVQVEVIKKKHTPARTTVIMSGKVPVSTYVAARYETTITDNDYTKTIDDKSWYDNLEIGDRFEVEKITYKDKSGEVFSKDFKLIERGD